MGRVVSSTKLATVGAAPPPTEMLSRLRDDLAINPGPIDAVGQPTWHIYDALRHRFIVIDQATCTILSMWRDHADAASLAAAATERLGQPYTRTDIDELARFLVRCNLTRADSDEWRKHLGVVKGGAHGTIMKLVHNYLFFKIPLFAPKTSAKM